MTRPFIPQDVLDLAHARASARTAGDWKEADRLRLDIEGAGWRVVDNGTGFRLDPAAPLDIDEGGLIRYGRSTSVPSRMSEPSSARATVVLVAGDGHPPIEEALEGVLAHASPEDHVLVIVDDLEPGLDLDAWTRNPLVEIIRTTEQLGAGAALNIVLRRATGAIVLLLEGSVVPTGDVVGPLAAALADADVAVAGGRGITTSDLRLHDDVEVGEATAVAAGALAFRRIDGIAAGPVDEAFRDPGHLDTWWSLVLRDGDRDGSNEPRRAIVVRDLPVRQPSQPEVAATPDPANVQAERLARRNFYRLLSRFRDRPELLAQRPAAEVPGRPSRGS